MTIIIDSVLILLFVFNVCYAESECTVSLEDADKCGLKTSFFGNREVLVPTSEEELDKHCSATMEGVKCVQDFVATCLTGFVKQTSELALTNGARHMDKRCKDAKDRKDFLKYVKCYTDKTKLEPLHVCSDKNMAMLEMFLNRDVPASVDDDMGAGCCIFQFFLRCIHHANLKVCDEETTEYWEEVITEITEDTMAFSCAGFETVGKCEKALKPEVWAELMAIDTTEDPKVIAAKLKHQSGIALMIDFLKKVVNK